MSYFIYWNERVIGMNKFVGRRMNSNVDFNIVINYLYNIRFYVLFPAWGRGERYIFSSGVMVCEQQIEVFFKFLVISNRGSKYFVILIRGWLNLRMLNPWNKKENPNRIFLP